MYDIIGKSKWFFIFSALIIIPGIISLFLWGLRLSIDFTGGTLIELRFKENVSAAKVSEAVRSLDAGLVSVSETGDNTYLLRLKPVSDEENERLRTGLEKSLGELEELRYETVGPVIGAETAQNAAKSVAVASLAIIVYVALSFRSIPRPYSSWKFGFSAVFALVHDILVVLGIFSLLGHFYNIEIDSLFITALLTVMGFSVHDSIVVFDRIRENLRKMAGRPFAEIVNVSLVQTLARSLSTSLTVVFTLTALLLFSGSSIRWFIVALLVGIISGTYSSIFNAAPLLVLWQKNRKSTP